MNDLTTFVQLAMGINRDGIEQLLNWLIYETDFATAPASTRFHGAEQGGLLRHSLSVYYNLRSIVNAATSYDSVLIVSLFHDICKANYYEESTRNVKNPETGVWEQVPFYKVKEHFPYGAHGGKSVYLLMSHGLKLTDEEAVAINCHMGGWDVTNYHNPSGAYEKYPLAVYLHIADMLATYIDKT